MKINTEKRGEYSTCLNVEDYYASTGDHDMDVDDAFEIAQSARADVVDAAKAELEDVGLKNFRVLNAEFVEFDSGNISHAGAHFNVLIEGATTEELEALFA